MAVAEEDVVESVARGMLLVHRVGDRPRLMGAFEVECHHHGSVDVRVIADKDCRIVVEERFTNGFGFAERQMQKSAHCLIIDVAEFWHVVRSFNGIYGYYTSFDKKMQRVKVGKCTKGEAAVRGRAV